MTGSDDDVLRIAFRLIVTELGVDRQAAWDLDRRLRDLYGGERHYIRRAPVEGKAHDLGAALAAGATAESAIEAAGLSPAHGYRLLRRRWVTCW